MSLLDAAVHVGKESTYGTAVTPTRSFEAKADGWKSEREGLESVGMRAGMQTTRSDRRKVINMGGAGAIEVDVLNKGMGLLLDGLLGTTTGPTQQSSTIAYLQTFASNEDGPTSSFTVQLIRPYVASGSSAAFTHHGCMATGWGLSQEVNGLLTLNIDYDFEDVDTATSAATATYPAAASPFDWTQAVLTVGGSAFDVRSFEFQADLAMKTDRRYLRGSALKKQPVRSGVPEYSGTIVADFDALTRYNEFVAGTVVEDVVITWTGAQIVSGHDYTIAIAFPAVQWTGESPEASISDVSTQPLPFKVLHDGTDPAVTLTYKSIDTSL